MVKGNVSNGIVYKRCVRGSRYKGLLLITGVYFSACRLAGNPNDSKQSLDRQDLSGSLVIRVHRETLVAAWPFASETRGS